MDIDGDAAALAGGLEGDAAGPRTPPSSRAWGGRWFGAMLVVVYVAVGLHLALDAGRWQQFAFLWIFLPLLGAFVGAMAAVATAARWALARRWSPRVPVSMVVGALAGPVLLFLLFASADLRILAEPTRAGLDVVFSPPMVLGGAAAAWLAERQISPRHPVWLAAVLVAALLGLALIEPISALLPRYGTGIPSWPPT